MQYADHLINIVPVHRQACVFALLDDLLDGLVVFVEVDAEDFVVRHHDVVNRHFLEIEDADQHLPVAAGDTVPGFVYDRAQFLPGQRVEHGVVGVDAEQAQHAVRRGIGQPDDRIGDFQQRVIYQRGGKRDPLGM